MYLKEEEDALAGTGGTRLLSQPSCEFLLHRLIYFIAINITGLFVTISGAYNTTPKLVPVEKILIFRERSMK